MTDIIEVLRNTDRMTTWDAALAFARAGLPVFPCVPAGKRPLTPAGFHDATTNEERIRQWWRKWPNANIGIPTGTPSGIDVVDVDVRETGSGIAAFQAAVDLFGIRDLARVRTPSGGIHAYFPTSDVPQSCWQAAAAHIDFRGDGGYVLAPPSRLLVRDMFVDYRVISLTRNDPTPVDAALLRNLIDPRTAPARAHRRGAKSHPAALAGWVSRLPEGERNHGLFWAACRLFDGGTTHHEAVSVLRPAAMQAGLGEREIARTIHSAWRHSTPHPAQRSLPEAGPHRAACTPRDPGPAI